MKNFCDAAFGRNRFTTVLLILRYAQYMEKYKSHFCDSVSLWQIKNSRRELKINQWQQLMAKAGTK